MKLDKNAMGLAFLRGVESLFHADVRFFEDSHAFKLIPGKAFGLVAGLIQFRYFRNKIIARYEKSIPGVYGNVICRTRYIDEKLQQAIAEGVKNVIILNAGLDMRAHRITGMAALNVFEIDKPSLCDFKQKSIQRLINDSHHVTYLPVNLKKASLQEVLAESGCDNRLKTLFIWEGQSQYFPKKQVESILKSVSTFAKGSEIIFSYLLKEVIPEYSQEEIEGGLVTWQFGLQPELVAQFLKSNQLQLIEDLDASEFERRYITPSKRNLGCLATERLLLAQV